MRPAIAATKATAAQHRMLREDDSLMAPLPALRRCLPSALISHRPRRMEACGPGRDRSVGHTGRVRRAVPLLALCAAAAGFGLAGCGADSAAPPTGTPPTTASTTAPTTTAPTTTTVPVSTVSLRVYFLR